MLDFPFHATWLVAGQVVGAEQLRYAAAWSSRSRRPVSGSTRLSTTSSGRSGIRSGRPSRACPMKSTRSAGRPGSRIRRWASCRPCHPDGRREVHVETGEPGVALVVGGAGLADDVFSFQGQGASCGAAFDHFTKHVAEDVDRGWSGDARCDPISLAIDLGGRLVGRAIAAGHLGSAFSTREWCSPRVTRWMNQGWMRKPPLASVA